MTHPSDDRLEEVALRLLRLDSNPLSAPAEGAATLRACKRRGVGVKPLDELEAGDFAHLVVPALFRPCAHGGGWWETTDADGRNVLLRIETPALTDTPDTDTQADRLAELEAERDAARAEDARVSKIALSLCEHMEMVSSDMHQKGAFHQHINVSSLADAAKEARAAMQEGGE